MGLPARVPTDNGREVLATIVGWALVPSVGALLCWRGRLRRRAASALLVTWNVPQGRLVALLFGMGFLSAYCYAVATNVLFYHSLRAGFEESAITAGAPNQQLFVQQEPLLDLAFLVLPSSQCGSTAKVIFHVSGVAGGVVWVWLALASRVRELAALTVNIAAIWAIKGTAQILTLTPSPDPTCFSEATNKFDEEIFDNLVGTSAWMLYKLVGSLNGCSDNMFSGHIAIFAVSLLQLRRAVFPNGMKRTVVNVLFPLLIGLQMFCIIACRAHYASDTFLALIFAGLLHTHRSLHDAVWTMCVGLTGVTLPANSDEG